MKKNKFIGMVKILTAIAMCAPAPAIFASGVACIAVAEHNMNNLYENFQNSEAYVQTLNERQYYIDKLEEMKANKEISDEYYIRKSNIYNNVKTYLHNVFYSSAYAKQIDINENLKFVGKVALSLGTILGASITGVLATETKKREYTNKDGNKTEGNIIQAYFNEGIYQLF